MKELAVLKNKMRKSDGPTKNIMKTIPAEKAKSRSQVRGKERGQEATRSNEGKTQNGSGSGRKGEESLGGTEDKGEDGRHISKRCAQWIQRWRRRSRNAENWKTHELT